MHILQIKRHFQGEVLPLEVTSEKHETMPFLARGVFPPWRSPLRNTKNILICWQLCGVTSEKDELILFMCWQFCAGCCSCLYISCVGNSVLDVACECIYVYIYRCMLLLVYIYISLLGGGGILFFCL